MTTLVRVAPNADVFPVRAKYNGVSQTIGLNYLSSGTPLWSTLADVIASKLCTGKTPEILEAITFSPKEPQAGLKPISIAGNGKYKIDPYEDDFFKKLIDLRNSVKAELTTTKKQLKAINRELAAAVDMYVVALRARMGALTAKAGELDSDQQALKILANSTSYGIFVEMIVAAPDSKAQLTCFGPSGEGFAVRSDKVEEPGRYFHPLLATLITGAARLMLGVAETLCLDRGLDWAFCDTDSLAIAKPEAMKQSEFFEKAQSICNWFSPLNPYEIKGPIFKIEDANYSIGSEADEPQLEALYSYCISAKRYVLFNIREGGEIIIRKASAHGLGQYLAPYDEKDTPSSIPAPSAPLEEIGVDRWHYDLWHEIIRATLEGHPDQVDLSYHRALNQPAVSRYGATTRALLKWFAAFNAGREYPDQVKPFNFLNAFHARLQFELPDAEQWAKPKRGRPQKPLDAKPIAAFNRDNREAAKGAFNRETGKPIPASELKTYAEALAQYHLRPEAKFLNGEFGDRGRTERRHVVATQLVHIGKEANKWEEQHFLGEDEDTEIEYGATPGAVDDRLRELREFVLRLGERQLAKRLQISRGALRRIIGREERPPAKQVVRRILLSVSHCTEQSATPGMPEADKRTPSCVSASGPPRRP